MMRFLLQYFLFFLMVFTSTHALALPPQTSREYQTSRTPVRIYWHHENKDEQEFKADVKECWADIYTFAQGRTDIPEQQKRNQFNRCMLRNAWQVNLALQPEETMKLLKMREIPQNISIIDMFVKNNTFR